eukprot:evm.model.scf_617.1 EVM.evm.TU.scf_617.1   scf_617:2401-9197(-)
MANMHPKWTENVEEAYDAVLLHVPCSVKVQKPGLAERGFNAAARLAVVAFMLGHSPELAPFHMVRNTRCPHVKGMVDSMLCTHSNMPASMYSGCSGGPVLQSDGTDGASSNTDGKTNDTRHDVVVGVLSYANFSALSDSGAEIVPSSPIREWIGSDTSEEQRMEMANMHPKWTENVEEAYDAVLLHIPCSVKVQKPGLAERGFNAAARLAVVAFMLGHSPELAPFHMVRNTRCPHVKGMVDSMLCTHSNMPASMYSGCSGGPVLQSDGTDGASSNTDGKTNDTRHDVVVGVLSYANFSALSDSGAEIVPSSPIREWIGSDTSEAGGCAMLHGRFPCIVSVRGRHRERHCMVLTSANCVQNVGPNPIMLIGSEEYIGGRWTEGVQEQRMEMANMHPKWTENVEEAYDAVLLHVPCSVKVQKPGLAERGFNAAARLAVVAFMLGHSPELAPFHMVRNTRCPHVKGMVDSMLCTHSNMPASMYSGCSGGPVLQSDGTDGASSNTDGKTNDTRHDVVVGVLSYANFSALSDSGAEIVPSSPIREWIGSDTSE